MLFRIGHGYDVHALAEGLPLVLGGVGIEHDKGCVAHSDGDVVIHALCDALLGAAALGDIGLHFPDTSDDYKGIDSKLLLHRVAELLAQKGYCIGNVDCTTQTAPPHRPDAPDAGRRHGNRCRLRFSQGHHDRAARLRGPRRGRLGLGRSAHLPGITFGTILL